MQKLAAILLTALFPALAGLAQTDPQIPLREAHGQTIISNELPKADLTVSKDFHYVGGQRVNLYCNVVWATRARLNSIPK
jgi:hypothetical protein